jgi:DNA topoisomerase-2
MNTPILKARKGNQELVFSNEGEYQTWKTEQLGLTSDVVDISEPVKGWKIKYYKGLGTSTGKEFREYFEKKKFVGFKHLGKSSDDAIDMVFNKKRADDRKIWLGKYNREDYLDTNKSDISYEEFINRELIHFSKYDCDRSIPNLMDGLKISLRKILYSAFKKGLTHEIKVAQFTGYVSEHSGYHHGEASLNAAIVGLAQNFVGSNNINLFAPNGQFGTRLKGGQDSASERYIFTHLNRITRHIFNEQDDKILKYLNDDGLLVEPLYYAPILPMILVNGAKGIGTGFSTDIMSYNPTTIIQYLKSKLMLEDTSNIHFIPYYEGFTGTITPVTQSQHDGKFLIRGKYEKVGPDKIRVTELPVGTWTDDFKEYLETLADASAVDKAGKKIPAIVKDYDDMSKDTTIDFTITLAKGKVAELEAVALENGCNGLEKQFKLFTTGSTSNMHLFDAFDKLKKYGSVNEIIDDYFETRLDMYKVRKEYMIEALTKELVLLTNKMRYIRENLDGTIDLRRKKKDEVVAMLKNKGFDVIGDDEDYKYLTKMAMDSVTEENVAKLEKEHGDKETELNRVKETTIQQMWFGELEKLEEEYVRFREERERSMSGDAKKKSGGGANIVKKKSAPKKQLTLVE